MTRLREALQSRLGATSSLHDLSLLIEQAIRPFGLSHFAIGAIPSPGQDSAIWVTNWPALWFERYAIDGYAAEDIAVHEAGRSPEPRTWTELKALHPGVGLRLLATAAELGWKDGFVVPVHHAADGRKGLVAMMGEELRLPQPKDRKALIEVALMLYTRAETLYAMRSSGPTLTRREREALSLVAQGFDDGAIGAELGITKTSAHAYVERAKKRLGASTRAQAVALAMTYSLIRTNQAKPPQATLCL